MPINASTHTSNDRELPVEENIPNGKRYHAMFSYRNLEKETTWVRDTVQTLEENYNIKCCDHDRDFTPGKEIAVNFTECLEKSSKVVIVLSKEYMDSKWCKHELHSSFFKSNAEGEVVIIPVVIEDCEIPEFLKPITHIDARGDKDNWLPKLALTILRPGEEVVTPEMILRERSLRWLNLTTLHCEEVKLKFRGCVFDKYVPDNLKSYGVEVPSNLYGEVLDNIASTKLVKGRHCRFPSCGAGCCWFILFVACEYVAINALIRLFPYENLDNIQAAFFFILLPALISLLWLPVCIATTQKGKKQMEKVLIEANYKMMKYNVLVTFYRESSICIYFVCYYCQCYDHLEKLFRSCEVQHLGYCPQTHEHTVVKIEYDSNSSSTQTDETSNETQPLLVNENPKETTAMTDPVRLICSRFAAEYLQTYIIKELPSSDECHTSKVICLCKYIALHWRDKSTEMTKDEQCVLSTIFGK